ncbi:hypothetical protein GCM10007924_09860 [Sneathiella chinensis]|uniref:Sulfotransferase domain-containing protein n=2 Tax=Sneathiella chinensis TaxID=349750 RepID=A0ABQ5U274_9PROT|nr:hypothetical protein GCM10007924_09860 [Sneathiella chinensis]
MELLQEIGLPETGDFAAANEQNPRGFFEDIEILNTHKQFYEDVAVHPMLPLRETAFESEAADKCKRKLKGIVERRFAETNGGIWGFKDPRTNALLPAWRQVFTQKEVVPKYILALRDPASVAVSMGRQNKNGKAMAELVWLSRVSDALYHTGGNCFVLHYEHLFTDKAEQIMSSLAGYLGLQTDKAEAAVQKVIQTSLNRSVSESYKVQNPHVSNLYSVLRNIEGPIVEELKEIQESVQNIRSDLNNHMGWVDFANQQYGAISSSGPSKEAFRALECKISELVEARNQLVCNNRDYKAQIQNLRKDLRKQRMQVIYTGNSERANVENNSKEVKSLKNKLVSQEKRNLKLTNSISYRLGKMLVDAVYKPGRNTLLLPFRVIGLILSKTVVKKWA